MTVTGAFANFHAANNSASFKFKQKITCETGNGSTENVEIMALLKYLSNFWKTPQITFTNWEINLIWTWSENYGLSNDTKATTSAITGTKLYVTVVALSTQDVYGKLLQQLKSGLKWTINWDKNQSEVAIKVPNPCLDYLIDPGFQGVNRLFVSSFENSKDRTVHRKYYLPTAEVKDNNVMINGKNFLEQSVKNNLRT